MYISCDPSKNRVRKLFLSVLIYLMDLTIMFP